MPTAADALFARYRRTRDPECLAQVFDALAPRLLRLAIHLARDGAGAEDLVQATFLAAIERAEEFDAARELEPWLVGILSNKARLARRDATRRPDPQRLAEERALDPAHAAEGAELSREVRRALDEVEEPYRAVLLLHLVHGLEPVEIAHVLDRAPGTVRVQLHRGRERLRERLPAGLALPAVLVALPASGLDAVRAAVLAQAKLVAGVGGMLVMKKWVLAVVVLLLALVGWRLGTRASAEEVERIAAQPPVELAPPASPTTSAPRTADAVEAPEAARETVTASPAPAGFLRGRVLDGVSGEPLAGARVAWYRSERAWSLAELARERADFVEQDLWGGVQCYTSLPLVRTSDADGETHPGEAPRIWDRPQTGDTPVAETRAAADGSFRLEVDTATWALIAANTTTAREDVVLGALQCECDGYGTSCAPLFFPAAEQTFRLWPERPLAGYVIDPSGARVTTPLRLLFFATSSYRQQLYDARKGEQLKDGALDIRGAGVARIVETRADGSFELTIGAEEVAARSRTSGWFLTGEGFNPEWKQQWSFRESFKPGEETEPVLLVARQAPTLLVLDAETGAPVESFSLRLDVRYNAFASHAFAPGGRLQLQRYDEEFKSLGHTPAAGVIWSADHRFTRFELADLLAPVCTEVRLERGREEPTLGRVLRGGVPVRATVGFQPQISPSFRRERFRPFTELATEADGTFAALLPPGSYLLRVAEGERTVFRRVELPADAPLVIELAEGARVVVDVRDSLGVAKVEHAVGLAGQPEGFQQRLYTDASGRVEFTDLPPGNYRVHVPLVSTTGSFSGGEVQTFELARSETRAVEITLPTRGAPRFARVVADAPLDLAGWRARNPYPETEWLDLEADGRVPLDLSDVMNALEVRAPDERRWRFDVPRDAPDGFELRVSLAGPCYVGMVTDLAGNPRARLRVSLRANGTEASVSTDRAGEFRLAGDGTEPRLVVGDMDPLGRGSAYFEPALPPSSAGTALRIRAPRLTSDGAYDGLANVRVTGTVRSTASGKPVPGAQVSVQSLHPDPSGTLVLSLGAGFGWADSDGRFTLLVPRGPSVRAYPRAADDLVQRAPDEFPLPPDVLELEHDLWIP